MRIDKSLGAGNGLRGAFGVLSAAFLVAHLSLLLSCSSIDCPVQNTVNTVYNLMKPDGTPDTLLVDTLWVWTPRANGRGASQDFTLDENDTVLVNRLCGSSASTFTLPISLTLPEDTLCTLLVDTLGHEYVDTILLKKDNHPHFESVDCQASYFHTITGVRCTHRAIDSVTIHHAEVNYDASQAHLYIYFKARR